jgi:hypothetical protein
MEEGPMFDPCRIPGSRSLHGRKLATWAVLVGETRSSVVHAEQRGRPHRGMLPDVDFSRAVSDYSRPSLLRRVARLLLPKGGMEWTEAGKPVVDTSGAYIDRKKVTDPCDSVRAAGHNVLPRRRPQRAPA